MPFTNKFSIEQLTEENVADVHTFCEKNMDHWSQPFRFFKLASLGDTQYNAELTLIARDEDEKVAGFFMGTTRNKTPFFQQGNVLKFFMVRRDLRRQGIGTWMLKKLYVKFKEQGRKGKIQALTSTPDFWFSGVNPKFTAAYFWLQKNGYKKSFWPWNQYRQDLYVEFDNPNIPIDLDSKPPEVKGNFEFKRVSPEYFERTVEFAKKHHGLGTWPEEIELSYRNDPPTTFIAVNIESDEIIGWATHSGQFDGSFGPTAVLKSLRGQGIGGILLAWSLYDLKQSGHKRCQILWVVGDTVKYYSKVAGAYIGETYYPMKGKIR